MTEAGKYAISNKPHEKSKKSDDRRAALHHLEKSEKGPEERLWGSTGVTCEFLDPFVPKLGP